MVPTKDCVPTVSDGIILLQGSVSPNSTPPPTQPSPWVKLHLQIQVCLLYSYLMF